MPFDEIETITKDNEPPKAKITYLKGGHVDGANRETKRPKLMISIPTTICGLSKAERFKLLLGTGIDTGKVLVRGCTALEKGGVKPSQHAHFFRFNFGFVPKLGEDVFDGEHQPVRKVDDETFEITVPVSWFDYKAAGK